MRAEKVHGLRLCQSSAYPVQNGPPINCWATTCACQSSNYFKISAVNSFGGLDSIISACLFSKLVSVLLVGVTITTRQNVHRKKKRNNGRIVHCSYSSYIRLLQDTKTILTINDFSQQSCIFLRLSQHVQSVPTPSQTSDTCRD